MPRATTAAWDVMPPRAVSTPWAWMTPWMSSGVVSKRTRITASPARPRLSAVSASKTALPTAAPGEALQARGEHVVARRSGRCRGAAAGRAGRGRSAAMAVARGRRRPRRPSRAPSARPPRRCACPMRVCRMYSLPLLDRELDVLHVAVVALEQLHRVAAGRRRRPGMTCSSSASGARRADAGDDVLALRVHQELAVELALARRRVAREGDAGALSRRPCCRTPSARC